jgi:hypothetical protein
MHLAEARAARAAAELRHGNAVREAARLHACLAEAGHGAPRVLPGASAGAAWRAGAGLRPGMSVRSGGAAAALQRRQHARQLHPAGLQSKAGAVTGSPARRRAQRCDGIACIDVSTLLQPGGALLGPLGWLAAAVISSGTSERQALPLAGEGFQLRTRGSRRLPGGWLLGP